MGCAEPNLPLEYCQFYYKNKPLKSFEDEVNGL